MRDQKAHFERLYRMRDDPWGYETSPYEAAKYAATIAALKRPRYAFAIEAGCSIGVLSARLATLCDRLLSLDLVEQAVEKAANRLNLYPGARAMRATLPADWPQGNYDLIVLSELLYYLDAPAIDVLARCVARDAVDGAECVVVHYQGDTGTAIRPNAARDQFCRVLNGLRRVEIIDQPCPEDYNHRTMLIHS